jgi:outer membrane protein TolC
MRTSTFPNAVTIGAVAVFVIAAAVAAPAEAGQQTATPPAATTPLRIDAAVDLALKNYPAMRAAAAQEAGARAGVDAARTAFLPRTDLLWQENRATRNNVAGLLLPQGVIPSISGPVSAASYTGVWGSAVGALFSWEPFDFGLRRANVTVAENLVKQASAGMALTRLQVAIGAADTFLAAASADETVRATQASVDRLQVVQTSVTTLVRNQLRPGADESRAAAEVAAARVQLIRVQLSATLARATLAQAIGLGGESVTIDAGPLAARMPAPPDGPVNADAHPIARVQQAVVETTRSREQALASAYVPRLNFQSSVFARGSVPAGLSGSGATGLWPDTSNWAAGLTFTFPVFDISGIRARRGLEMNTEAADRARYDAAVQAVRTESARARAELDAARQIAALMPAELTAARDAETRARARYDAGLATMTEVADAERLLAQAETDDALSRLGAWRALLADAGARGDLAPFLDQVKSATAIVR